MTQDNLATRDDETIYPDHYNVHPSGHRAIDISRWLSSDLAQAFQYVWRCGQKDAPIQELNKAIWFIEDELTITQDEKHTVNYLKIEQKLPDILSYEMGYKREALANIARANQLHAPRYTMLCKALQAINAMIKEYESGNDKS